MKINLIVLRCSDIEKNHDFYQELGFVFKKEQHGNGPTHYASDNFGFILELYPLKENQLPDNIRLGFITSINFNDLTNKFNIIKSSTKKNNQLIITIQDPDGRKIDLIQ